MTVLLIHFSDIHFKTNRDEIFNRISAIKNAIKDKLSSASSVFLIVSGDIAYSGKAAEYEVAQHFFSDFQGQISDLKGSANITFIIVPGNHDCDFGVHGATRELVIQNIREKPDLLEKEELLNDCLKPIDNFFNWSAYSNLLN